MNDPVSKTVAPPRFIREAPCHPDPYPYYSRLARECPVFREGDGAAWVVAGADAVKEVLYSESCFTRPADQGLPPDMQGPTGDLFGRLVRLRDDDRRDAIKGAIVAAIEELDLSEVAARARQRAIELERELGALDHPGAIGKFNLSLPIQVLAELLGIGPQHFDDLISWIGDYGSAAAAMATGIPTPEPELIQHGHHAAKALLTLAHSLVERTQHQPLLASLLRHARGSRCDDTDDLAANTVGLLTQGSATAGLIGTCLLVLARNVELRNEVSSHRDRVHQFVQEVIRIEPPTNNTLRFVARDAVIAGQQMLNGDSVIVSLAAAGRDPRLNTDPDEFNLARPDREYLEFGRGRHACPANRLAPCIAEVAVDYLLNATVPFDLLVETVTYAPSGFIRNPQFMA